MYQRVTWRGSQTPCQIKTVSLRWSFSIHSVIKPRNSMMTLNYVWVACPSWERSVNTLKFLDKNYHKLTPGHDKLSLVSSIHIKAEPGSMSSNPRDRRVKTGGFPGAPWGSLGAPWDSWFQWERLSQKIWWRSYLGRCIVLTFGLYIHTYTVTLGHTHTTVAGVS